MQHMPAARATRTERTIASAFCCALAIAVAISLPVRGTPVGPRPGFLIFYSIVLGTTISLTAIVLYWRARTNASAKMARLAAAYAFCAPLMVANALLLPGIAVIAARSQISPWLWVFWHIGWSLLIVVYALTPERLTRTPGRAPLLALAVALVLIALDVATPAFPLLLHADGTFYPIFNALYIACAVTGLAATGVLARRFRALSEFELWIFTAAIAITLDAIVNVLGTHRFSLGFYAGRSLALISGTVVLIAIAANFVGLVRRADATFAERRVTDQLDFFARLGDSLGRTPDRGGALRALAQGLVPRIADWTIVSLVNGDGRLVLESAFHRNPEKARLLEAFVGASYDLPDARSVAWRVYRSAQPLIGEVTSPARVRDGVSPAFGAAVEQIGMRSYIAVPIAANGLVYGCLHALASESDITYTERDLPFFSEIGRRMGNALQNADMYERESRIARAFQRAALPATLPAVPGLRFSYLYEPAGREANVGGDFYDAFRLTDGRVVISIGDVAGAGVAAAATMAALRQSIRAIAAISPSPDLLLRAAEGAFAEGGPPFASAFVAVIDPIKFSMRYANAGHPPPLLRAPDGTIRALGSNDVLLGLSFENVAGPREVEVTRIEPGSLLVLYTDGLSEADYDALAGEDRLRGALRDLHLDGALPERAAVAIRDAVLGAGATSHDDVAVLAVAFDTPMRANAGLVTIWEFDCHNAAEAQRVRHELVAALRSAGLHDDDLFATEMIYSELVGNGLRHAAPLLQVILDLSQDAAVLHVLDRGEGFYLNSKLPADAFSERGRGLYIISQLAREFSVTPRPGRNGSHARVVLTGRIRIRTATAAAAS